MRKSARALVLVVVSFVGTVVLAVAAALSSAVALGAVALIVPGTGTPNANVVEDYRQNFRDYYMQDTACTNAANCPDENLIGINYPASFFPLVIFPGWCEPGRCQTWDESVGLGAAGLQEQLDFYLASDDPDHQQIVIAGYSQGGAVVANVLQNLGSLSDEDKARIEIVTIGGIENQDGGLWSRLSPLNYIPFFNISFRPSMTANTGVNYTAIGAQYDPVTLAPTYLTNPFSLLNALAAFDRIHGFYLAPNGNDLSAELFYGYDPDTLREQLDCGQNPGNCRYDEFGNTYITIPATSLPIMDLITSLVPSPIRPLVKPFISLVSPVYKLLADLGYDFSGDPSVVQPFSLLPFNPLTFNPITFSVQFAAAVVQGVQAFVADLGGLTETLAPATTTQQRSASTLAAASAPVEEVEPLADPAGTARAALTVVPDIDDQATTEPVVTEPVVTEPVVTEPVVTEPVVTEPVVTEPVKTTTADGADGTNGQEAEQETDAKPDRDAKDDDDKDEQDGDKGGKKDAGDDGAKTDDEDSSTTTTPSTGRQDKTDSATDNKPDAGSGNDSDSDTGQAAA